jgi:hypothetical protein
VKRRAAIEAFKSAADCIGTISHEMSLFAITRGQFSMLDAILHCLNELGPSQITVWTWTIAEYEVEAMAGLMSRQDILGARLVIDRSADYRNQAIIENWRQQFGEDQVRICLNHAKIARVWNDRFKLLIRGSMNLNFNPRFEQFDLTEGGPDFDLVERIENELPVLPRKYSRQEAANASGVSKAFEAQQLKMFEGIKVWAK